MIGRITFLYDIGGDGFPLAIFQVLPLVRAVCANPETGLEDVAVVATRFPGNTKSLPSGRVHFLPVEPLVVWHRWVVSVSSNGKQDEKTEDRQYATERFHGSLRYGLSPNPRIIRTVRQPIRPHSEENGISFLHERLRKITDLLSSPLPMMTPEPPKEKTARRSVSESSERET